MDYAGGGRKGNNTRRGKMDTGQRDLQDLSAIFEEQFTYDIFCHFFTVSLHPVKRQRITDERLCSH
jgi:hypothetical protein